MTSAFLENLNPEQRLAVETVDNPVLVLAGAGSGKTRVLTCKIGYLLEQGIVSPYQILAVTFTNKAASEMKHRIEGLLGRPVDGMWIGTFHSLCARILRIESAVLGYTNNFTIYDVDDQIRLIQQLMTSMNIDQQLLKPRQVQHMISDCKNKMIGAARFEEMAHDLVTKKVARLYYAYEENLRRNNAMDFDDLLIKPLDIFTRDAKILEKYRDKFRYVLVDEYQDTNKAQYYLVRQLTEKHQNICVVGDEDQSIYRWRGADIENILTFEKDYPDCRVVRLEQNYRSSQTILKAANAVVANNQKRLGKNLWSDKGDGDSIGVFESFDESDEASRVVSLITKHARDLQASYNDIAVLYRTNAQSRALEDKLRRSGISYNIVGGTKFYDRKEIKDILAYLRVLINPRDAVALRRIINFPPRGIGLVSQQRLERLAESGNMTLFESLARVGEIGDMSAAARKKIYAFGKELEALQQRAADKTAYEIASELLEKFPLKSIYEGSNLPDDEARLDNVNELMNSIAAFTDSNYQSDAGLARYLEDVALLTDIDRWDPSFSAVTLMTMHSAKGLEFPVIVITGLEDGLFPLSRSSDDPDDLEEERRLFYVGMTRAMENLYLTWAQQRRRFTRDPSAGGFRNLPSRFLMEIPDEFREQHARSGQRMAANNYNRYATKKRAGGKKSNFVPPPRKSVSNSSGYQVGDWVMHESYGKGQILGVENSNAGTKLTVIFAKKQLKKLIAEYANLKTVNA